VVAELQALRQFAYRDAVAPGKAHDGEQGLMLLRRNPDSLDGRFAEMDELPQRITERCQPLILQLGKGFSFRHQSLFRYSLTQGQAK
jgi:hypothetical protein